MGFKPLPTVDLEPSWIVPLGQRDLDGIEEYDTNEVWDALCKEAHRQTPGLWKDIEQEYRTHHSPDTRAQFVWRQVELRCRRPGGMYFFGRFVCELTRLLRRVHDKNMCRSFEKIPGTNLREFLLCHRGSYKSTVAGELQPVWVLGVRPWERIRCPRTRS